MKKTYRAFSGGELSEDMYGRYDVDKYGTGCKRILNWILMAQGGAFMRPGDKFVAEAGDSSKKGRLIRFEFSTEQAYALEFGHQYMRVYRNGGLVLEAAKNVVDVTEGAQTLFEVTSHGFSNGNEVYVLGLGGIVDLNQRNFLVSDVTTHTFKLKDKQGNYVDSSAMDAWTSGGTVARVYQIATPYGQDELFDVYFAQTADIMTLVHPSYAPRELTRTGHTAWTITTPTFAPSIAAPTGQSAAWTGSGSPSVSQNYKVTAIKDESFEESLPSAAANVTVDTDANWTAGEFVTVSWSSVSGAVKYNIYKEKAGTYGFIGSSESTSFIDDKIAPNVSNTPPRARNPFDNTNKYPSVVTFQQQRQIFASTNLLPDTIFMSKAGSYKNMSVSIPNKDDDAITFAIASGQVNKIRHLIPFKNLLAMTTGAEWKISADGGYTPTSMEATPETDYGSSPVRPLMIGNTAIFVGKYSRSVRDYNFTFESDGYDGNDLSILSKHLIKNRSIVDWSYAAEPDKLVWAVMSDGKMCTLTYMKEHKVWGWARQELAADSTGDAVVESVCVVPDEANRRDTVYFLVKRVINGNTVRYIEILQDYIDDPIEDAYFFDCGLSYDGAATDEIRGLWHLEGETVGILADGNVLPDTTVENGMITLPGEYSVIHVGLRYQADLWPLPPESDNGQDGSTKGDPKRIKTVQVEVVRTRGLKAGQSPDDEVLGEQFPEFEGFDLAGEIQSKTGIITLTVQSQWSEDGVAPFIRQSYPLPAKITSITPVYDT